MKPLSWNIRQGGGPRRDLIAECILAYDVDVIALVEFVPAASEKLPEFAGSGFRAHAL